MLLDWRLYGVEELGETAKVPEVNIMLTRRPGFFFILKFLRMVMLLTKQ